MRREKFDSQAVAIEVVSGVAPCTSRRAGSLTARATSAKASDRAKCGASGPTHLSHGFVKYSVPVVTTASSEGGTSPQDL